MAERADYSEVIAELRELHVAVNRLEKGQQELHDCLERNRGEVADLNVWRAVQDALVLQKEKELRRSFGLWSLLMAGAVAVIELLSAFVRRL